MKPEPEAPPEPSHLEARMFAADAIHSQGIGLAIVRRISSDMANSANKIRLADLPSSVEVWAEELDWLMECCEHTINGARGVLIKAGWLDENGRCSWNGSVPS